jgi:hypothetical protein
MESVVKRNIRNSNIFMTQTSPKNIQNTNNFKEYSLKQNFFDPSKSSPPNEFMMKLHMRMSVYNNVDNLIKE